MRDDAAREDLALNNRQARQQNPEVQSTHSEIESGGASPAADGIVSLVGNELRVDLDGIGPDPYAVAAQFSTAPGSVNILYNDINGVTFGLTI